MKHIGYVTDGYFGRAIVGCADRSAECGCVFGGRHGLMDTSLPFLTDKNGNEVRHPLNEWYRTPNMERMARQGIPFLHFLCAKCKLAFACIHYNGAECRTSSHNQLDQSRKQQPYAFRAKRLELGRYFEEDTDFTACFATGRI